jgi:hypothetical protein
MYISILFGAAYGVFYGLILSCLVGVIQVTVRGKDECRTDIKTRFLVRIVRSFVVLRPVGSRGTTVVDDPCIPTTAGSLAFQDHGRSEQGRGRHLGRGVCVPDRTQVRLPLDYLCMFHLRLDRSYIPPSPNRISPFPPHWVANVVAPHLDISPILFWCACFIGIGPVSVIHVTIGSGLDKMTSAEDFHILSLRNVLGLIGIGVAVMIPTALK